MLLAAALAFVLAPSFVPAEPAPFSTPHVRMAVGYEVVGRELEAVDGDNVFVAGEQLVVWTALAGVPAGFVEHVWERDGVEVARHLLSVGSSRRWRTWTRQTVEPGAWEVRVIGPDGTALASTSFFVAAVFENDDDIVCSH